MHDKVNDKINQVTEDTLITGVDIAKKKHYACAIMIVGKSFNAPFRSHSHLKVSKASFRPLRLFSRYF